MDELAKSFLTFDSVSYLVRNFVLKHLDSDLKYQVRP